MGWFFVTRSSKKENYDDPSPKQDRRTMPSTNSQQNCDRDTKNLVTGKKYRYRVRATIPYKPQPGVLLSAVRTITVKPVEYPAPTDPTDQNPQTVDTKTVYLKARQIGPFLRPYAAISLIPGEITEIEIPEVKGENGGRMVEKNGDTHKMYLT
ncbi:MAG: hypothetical protein ABGX16_11945 [Pirellulales bacterium]